MQNFLTFSSSYLDNTAAAGASCSISLMTFFPIKNVGYHKYNKQHIPLELLLGLTG